ncbi:gliding motility lipoprotein GldD [Mucilaginibacter panaciglaebae]|uniref:Gliding motility lipoprotein GldD n=1 Tax=Mucilaginibacter panaciglaebae TaxID=502331 RepID=A0ABP7WRZ1_9SPHI
MKIFTLCIIGILLLAACGDNHDYAPKPRGYFRIELPKKAYRDLVSDYPFTFKYPTYAVIQKDTQTRIPARLAPMTHLLNMKFPQFDGTLHLSYETITSKKVFDELVEDAHRFAFKNTVKATDIEQRNISIPANKVYCVYYAIGGNSASSVQFYLTDSVKNYLRGALYFNTAPRLDSIQPVLNFIKKDIDVMIGSFKWKR